MGEEPWVPETRLVAGWEARRVEVGVGYKTDEVIAASL